MTLTINGEPREIAAASIPEMVTELGLPPAASLVEHNGEALRRNEWQERELHEGDRIEIIRIVAGG
jgi:sulfur carrier protein